MRGYRPRGGRMQRDKLQRDKLQRDRMQRDRLQMDGRQRGWIRVDKAVQINARQQVLITAERRR